MKELKTYIGAFVFVVLCVLLGVWFGKRSCEPCPPEGYVLVEKIWLDSLQIVADEKPEEIEIVRDSIIYEPGPIKYVEVPVPIEINEKTNYYEDTLQSPHFEVYLFDTLRDNKIINRAFNYHLFVPETITKTITRLQKVPFPYEVDKRVRLYGGINIGMVNSIDLNYRLSDRNDMIGIGFGYAGKDKMIYGRYTFPIF